MSRRTIDRQGAAEISQWQVYRLGQAGMLNRKNPRKKKKSNPRKKKLPAHMKRTSRAKAESLYVFPRRKAYPIGDLSHARKALIYVMSPTNSKDRRKVIQAVAEAYPTYNWAPWWNKTIKKPKKDSTLKSWSTYFKKGVARSTRGRGGWEQTDTATKHRNPKYLHKWAPSHILYSFRDFGALKGPLKIDPGSGYFSGGENIYILDKKGQDWCLKVGEFSPQQLGKVAKRVQGIKYEDADIRLTKRKNPMAPRRKPTRTRKSTALKRPSTRRPRKNPSLTRLSGHGKNEAAKAMRLSHREGISLKAAWRKVKRG